MLEPTLKGGMKISLKERMRSLGKESQDMGKAQEIRNSRPFEGNDTCFRAAGY